MPLFMRVSPSEPGKPSIRGQDALNRHLKGLHQIPFPDDKLAAVREQARILSTKSKVQKMWEVIWVCWNGGKQSTATIVYVFNDGKRTFPKGKVGDNASKRSMDLKSCMERSGSICSRGYDPEKVAPKKAIQGRRRKVFTECPVDLKPIRASKPKSASKKQPSQAPEPVQDE
jgi:hypothetical protein